MTIDIQRFDNRETMLEALLQVITGDIETALQRNSSATLLLSGGSTPAPLYQQLSQARIDWEKVHIALVDERWVTTDNPASNECLLHETLLVNHAKTARFTGMKNAAASAFDGVQACNLEYAKLPLPHTVCLLGMGPDGHTASLFPQAQGLAAVTGELIERMTMTPWSILQSERLILLITGADKWEVLQQARAFDDATLMPISHFIDSEIPLEVYWAP